MELCNYLVTYYSVIEIKLGQEFCNSIRPLLLFALLLSVWNTTHQASGLWSFSPTESFVFTKIVPILISNIPSTLTFPSRCLTKFTNTLVNKAFNEHFIIAHDQCHVQTPLRFDASVVHDCLW